MAAPIWTLNGNTIRNPNTFKESFDVVGGDNITLRGRRRRAIHSTKRRITVSWTILSNAEYQMLRQMFLTQDPYSVYYTGTPLTVDCDAGELNLSALEVFMDLEDREVMPSTDFLNNVNATFLEV